MLAIAAPPPPKTPPRRRVCKRRADDGQRGVGRGGNMASGADVAVGDSENDKQRGGSGEKCGSDPATDDSSESDGDAQPTKAFHRRISTSKSIKNGVRRRLRSCLNGLTPVCNPYFVRRRPHLQAPFRSRPWLPCGRLPKSPRMRYSATTVQMHATRTR